MIPHLKSRQGIDIIGDELYPLRQDCQIRDVDDARVGTVKPAHLEGVGTDLVRAEDVPRHVGHHQRDLSDR